MYVAVAFLPAALFLVVLLARRAPRSGADRCDSLQCLRLEAVLAMADTLAAREVLARDWAAATRRPVRVPFERVRAVIVSRRARPEVTGDEARALLAAAQQVAPDVDWPAVVQSFEPGDW